MNDVANEWRLDERDLPWPQRPWLMALLCALAGLVFWWLVDDGDAARGPASAASGLAVATIALVLTIERRRSSWAVGFALGWGLVIALIAWMAAGYGRAQTVAEWPFFAGIFAVLLAAPLFQAARDHGTLKFPTSAAHDHVWTDAVIGAASLLFVLISWLLAWLISGLFELIGIRFIEQLLESGWFGWMLAGAAFGGAVGVLRERDALVATLHRLAMVVLSVLAPVLAAALVLFLASLPFAGLSGLWDGWASAAALTLAAGAGGLILANAALGPVGGERPVSAVFRWSALTLALAILPLAVLATIAMGLRIDQYGWTPERMWGVLAAAVALAIGLAGWWAVVRDRLGFAARWQQAQVRIGMAVCGIALLLALQLVDFGAISARDQLARLRSGALSAEEFDYTAMAFDFGPSGREALRRVAAGPDAIAAAGARRALALESRYDIVDAQEDLGQPALAQRLRVFPANRPLPAEAIETIDQAGLCRRDACLVRWIADDRLGVYGIIGPARARRTPELRFLRQGDGGNWLTGADESAAAVPNAVSPEAAGSTAADLSTARMEVRSVQRRQIFVNGQPVGDNFE